MNDRIDKIGELLVQYDEILDEYNMVKLCSQLEKNDKIVDLCDIMIKKYKGNLSNKLLNYFILNLFIIYDKNSQIKNKDKCFQSLEKVIEEYAETLSNMNLMIYMDMIIKLHR
tara:strand:- start:1466 stop:1804 length:339 start_codon:yes stop_codon:yes gene_type:complete